MVDEHAFGGPIFIVGMPRSGTKLLRSVMNNHSLIGITVNESGVIPFFHGRWSGFGDVSRRENFSRFYAEFTDTTFFERITEDNPFVDEEKWFTVVSEWSFAGVIEAFYRLYAATENKTIWGDKTPFYLQHIPLLKSLYPAAKFIHIIRDPRDYCLSMKKAWKKNLYRAAQRWKDSIIYARRDAAAHAGNDYLELQYERLLDDTETSMREICRFLGIEYEPKMVRLTTGTEDLGDAKGAVGIVRDNYGKWKTSLSRRSVVKIEKICATVLRDLNYPLSYEGSEVRLGNMEMKVYGLLDKINWLIFEIRRHSFRQGILNVFRDRRMERAV